MSELVKVFLGYTNKIAGSIMPGAHFNFSLFFKKRVTLQSETVGLISRLCDFPKTRYERLRYLFYDTPNLQPLP